MICSPRYLTLLGIMLAMMALPAARSWGEEGTESEKKNIRSTTPQTSHVAVVDVDKLFRENKRVRAAIDEMKKQVEINQAELAKDADNIRRQQRQLEQLSEESESYQQLAGKIAVAEAALTAKRLKFAEEAERHKSRIYYAFHQEVTTEITHFAQRYRINLVLPYDSSDLEVEDSAEEILHRMKGGPLYDNNIDITNDILRRMQGSGPGCLPPGVQEPPTRR